MLLTLTGRDLSVVAGISLAYACGRQQRENEREAARLAARRLDNAETCGALHKHTTELKQMRAELRALRQARSEPEEVPVLAPDPIFAHFARVNQRERDKLTENCGHSNCEDFGSETVLYG